MLGAIYYTRVSGGIYRNTCIQGECGCMFSDMSECEWQDLSFIPSECIYIYVEICLSWVFDEESK